MAQQLRPGEIVPESGVYRVSHEPTHVGALSQLTFIRGRRFPGCPDCRVISFELLKSDEVEWRHRSARRGRSRGPHRLSSATISNLSPAAADERRSQDSSEPGLRIGTVHLGGDDQVLKERA